MALVLKAECINTRDYDTQKKKLITVDEVFLNIFHVMLNRFDRNVEESLYFEHLLMIQLDKSDMSAVSIRTQCRNIYYWHNRQVIYLNIDEKHRYVINILDEIMPNRSDGFRLDLENSMSSMSVDESIVFVHNSERSRQIRCSAWWFVHGQVKLVDDHVKHSKWSLFIVWEIIPLSLSFSFSLELNSTRRSINRIMREYSLLSLFDICSRK